MLDPPLKDNPLTPPADSKEYLAKHACRNHKLLMSLIPRMNHATCWRVPRNTQPSTEGSLPKEAIGKSFLMPPEDDGTRHRACIIEIIESDQQCADEWKRVLTKFKCLMNDQWEEVVAYNQISDFIEQGESWVQKGNVCTN
jgi:hypothetical protein